MLFSFINGAISYSLASDDVIGSNEAIKAPQCSCNGIFPGASCDSGECTGGTVPSCSCGTFSSSCGCGVIMKLPHVSIEMISNKHIELLSQLERYTLTSSDKNDDQLSSFIKQFKDALASKNEQVIISSGKNLEAQFITMPQSTQNAIINLLQNNN